MQEIDPSLGVAELPDEFFEEDNMLSMGKKMMQEAMSAFPGIDEAMSYAEVMRSVVALHITDPINKVTVVGIIPTANLYVFHLPPQVSERNEFLRGCL